MTDLFTTPAPDASPEQFSERVLASVLGSVEVLALYLGDRLGWYAALRDHGPSTSAELAERTATVERYAREWLEHQAVSGFLVVESGAAAAGDDQDPATTRRYGLAPGAVPVLTDPDSLLYVAPLARFIAAAGRVLDPLMDAYRGGGGVSWAQLGTDAREAQASANRPMFLHDLTQRLLPSVPDLHARLSAGARVADVGCGEGWSAIGLARGYPGTTVHGFDVDEPSIAAARRHAAEAGLTDRVSFTVLDAGDASDAGDAGDAGDADPPGGPYDVVAAYECVHDLPDPVAVLRSMRRLAGADGYVLVMDERTAEAFSAPASPLERLLYGYSILVCLPDGLSHAPSVGTGTVMRPDVLTRYATAAGFDAVEILPLEHDVFRFYRLHT